MQGGQSASSGQTINDHKRKKLAKTVKNNLEIINVWWPALLHFDGESEEPWKLFTNPNPVQAV